MRLRPYKSCDAKTIVEWIKDENIFLKWGGARFGWVVVDDSIRGKGYGKQMLILGLKYAFEIFKVERVTIGVFENNEPALWCYKKSGFVETEIVKGEPWNVVEMEILKKNYYVQKAC